MIYMFYMMYFVIDARIGIWFNFVLAVVAVVAELNRLDEVMV